MDSKQNWDKARAGAMDAVKMPKEMQMEGDMNSKMDAMMAKMDECMAKMDAMMGKGM